MKLYRAPQTRSSRALRMLVEAAICPYVADCYFAGKLAPAVDLERPAHRKALALEPS